MSERDYKQEFRDKLRDTIHQEIHEHIHDRIADRVHGPKVLVLGNVHWGFTWGLVIALCGVGLLLQHMHIIAFNPVARFWPCLLILFGLMNLLTRSGRFFGFLLILTGAILQLHNLGYTPLTVADVWPIAIIAVGLLLMWASLETRGFIRAKKKTLDDLRERVPNAANVPPGGFHAMAVFGGCERRISTKNFQGGKATAVLGGIQLDFRDADMESEAVLELNCVLGGVELRVPENWRVDSRILPVLGGLEDTSRHSPETPDAKPKILTITGVVVLSGVEIRN